MIHYHVWFDLKPGVPEAAGLAAVGRFLQGLAAAGEAEGYQLLRNRGGPPRSRLPRFHALIEFASDAQLDAAMKAQAGRGIHVGLHGDVVAVVTGFHVEIFAALDGTLTAGSAGLHACEI